MTEEHCLRCSRVAPPIDGDEYDMWHPSTDADGRFLGVICPGCLTALEIPAHLPETDSEVGSRVRVYCECPSCGRHFPWLDQADCRQPLRREVVLECPTCGDLFVAEGLVDPGSENP